MSNARNLANLITGNFDVPLGALDNVPPSNDASALTTGTLPVGRLPSSGVSASSLTTGTLATPRLPAGSVIQVKQTVYSSLWTLGSGINDVTLPFSVTITPSSSSSKIWVSLEIRWFCINPNNGFGLYRGDPNSGGILLGDNPSNDYGDGWMGVDEGQMGNDEWEMYRDHYEYLDSPNTTSAVTYYIGWGYNQSGTSSASFQLNRSPNSTGPTAVSSISAWEIAG